MKLDDVVFLAEADVVRIHDRALAAHGGLAGLRDPGGLAAAVHAPQTGYYATLCELAAVLAHGIAMSHAFNDANKRTAHASAVAFLGANGRPVRSELGPEPIVRLVTRAITRDAFAAILADAIGGDVALAD